MVYLQTGPKMIMVGLAPCTSPKSSTMRQLLLLALLLLTATAMTEDKPPPPNPMETPGWIMMTPEERADHHRKMMEFKTYNACRAYQDDHPKQMEKRVKERHTVLHIPKHDGCDRMKRQGMLDQPK